MNIDFNKEIIALEKEIDDEYKKKNGIFYTDLDLANLMIEDLNISEDDLVMDPCCGGGTFIYSCLNRGVEKVYGLDKDKKAIKFCKEKIGHANIYQYDTLSNKGKAVLKKVKLQGPVDFVIGNPPYAPIGNDNSINISSDEDYVFIRELSRSGNNLFIAGLIRAFELVKDDGIISYIIPNNFLHIYSYSLLRRRILFDKTIVSITDIGMYFPQVRGEQVVLTIKNSKASNSKINFRLLEDGRFKEMVSIPQEYYKDEIILFNSIEDFNIYNKIAKSYQTLNDVITGSISRGKSKSSDSITGKEIRKFGFKTKKTQTSGNKIFIQNIYSSESGIIAALGGDYLAKETVTVLVDGDIRMCKYVLGVIHSRLCNYFLCKFIYNNSKLTMHTDDKYLERIPLVVRDNESMDKVIKKVEEIIKIEYLSEEWLVSLEELNDYTYDIYDLDQDEINHIEKEIRGIQSQRWFLNGKK